MKKFYSLLLLAIAWPFGSQAGVTTYSVVDTTNTSVTEWVGRNVAGEHRTAIAVMAAPESTWSGADAYPVHPEWIGKKIAGVKVFNQKTDGTISDYYIYVTENIKGEDHNFPRPQHMTVYEKTPLTIVDGQGVAWFKNPRTITADTRYWVGYGFTAAEGGNPIPMNPAPVDKFNGHALADWYYAPQGWSAYFVNNGWDTTGKDELGNCMIVYLIDGDTPGDEPVIPDGPGEIDYDNLIESCWVDMNSSVRYVGRTGTGNEAPELGLHMCVRSIWCDSLFYNYRWQPELAYKYLVGLKVTDQVLPVSKKRFPGHENYFIFVTGWDKRGDFINSPDRDLDFIAQKELEIGEDGSGVAYFDTPVLIKPGDNLYAGYGFDVTENYGADECDGSLARTPGLEFPVRKGAFMQNDVMVWMPRCADNDGGWLAYKDQRYWGTYSSGPNQGKKIWAGIPVTLLLWAPTPTEIEGLDLERPVVRTQFFDLAGREIINPTSGLVIKVKTLSNGKRQVTKAIL